MAEAIILINGTRCTDAQAMTIRVALNDFLAHLEAEGLGDDEHGRIMTQAYQRLGSEVLGLLHQEE